MKKLTFFIHNGKIMKRMCKNIGIFADVAELADALDLGSSVPDVQVQVLSSALNYKHRMPKTAVFRCFLFLKIKKGGANQEY